MLCSGHHWFQHTEYHGDITAEKEHKAQKHRNSKQKEHREVLQWSDLSPRICSLPQGLFTHFGIEESTNKIQKQYLSWPLPGPGCVLWGCKLHPLLFTLFFLALSVLFFFQHSGTTLTEEQWKNFCNFCLKPGNEGTASGICEIIWTASESPLLKERWTETDTFLFSWIFKEN